MTKPSEKSEESFRTIQVKFGAISFCLSNLSSFHFTSLSLIYRLNVLMQAMYNNCHVTKTPENARTSQLVNLLICTCFELYLNTCVSGRVKRLESFTSRSSKPATSTNLSFNIARANSRLAAPGITVPP